MSKFLKLSNSIINISHIRNIEINKDSYNIILNQRNNNGLFIMWLGWYNSDRILFEIDKKKHFSDYITVSNWINKLK